MTQANTIYKILHDAELYGQDYLQDLIEVESYGQDVTEQKTRFVILWLLIEALRRYYVANFDTAGTPITPDTTCLTTEQYNDLIRKIKEITGGKTYALSDWVLETGIWRSDGVWRSSGIWYAN